MRICPTCSAYYADESLAFCLVDGTALVSVDPGSEKWSEGSRAIEEKGNALRKQQRKLKWRRVMVSTMTMVVTTVVVCVVTLNGVFYLNPSKFPDPSLTPLYQISGRVTDASGPLVGAIIRLGGIKTDSTTTNVDGYYAFTKLPANFRYTVTADAGPEIVFTQPTISIDSLTQDRKSADFHVKPVPPLLLYTIRGHVVDARGPVADVTIRLSGTKTDSTTTKADGSYTFPDLQAGGSYTVTPSKPKMSFTPPNLPLDDLRRDGTAEFVGSELIERYTIRGHVTDARGPVADVTIRLSGTMTDSKTTKADGSYTFPDLQAGGSYTVTAVPGPQMFFTQPTITIDSLTQDRNSADFHVKPVLRYTISGRVLETERPGNIKIILSGGKSDSTMTGTNGSYSFPNLPANVRYTVTAVPGPQMFFTQPTITIDSLTQDRNSADFHVKPVPPLFYAISGHVTGARGPLVGVPIRLGGTKTDSTTTNADGYYTFTKLPAGGNYTVTPFREPISFAPPSGPVNNLRHDETANFVGRQEIELHSISGRVTDARGPLVGVTLRLSGTKTDSTTTNADGYYIFTKLPAGGNYTVTPFRELMRFAPPSGPVNNLRYDDSVNFTGVGVVSDKHDSPPIKTCTEEDQNRERENLISKYGAAWERSIAAEKSRVIADVIAAERLPAGVEPGSVTATASLGPIRYEVAFLKCKPRVVTARYEWTVQIFLPGRGIKVMAVPKHKTCGKVIGVWLCR